MSARPAPGPDFRSAFLTTPIDVRSVLTLVDSLLSEVPPELDA